MTIIDDFITVCPLFPGLISAQCNASNGLMPTSAQSRGGYSFEEPSRFNKVFAACLYTFKGKKESIVGSIA